MHVSDIPEITRLSVSEKILFVEELWDTISLDQEEISAPQSHVEELERRSKRHEVNPGTLLSLDELKSNLKNRH